MTIVILFVMSQSYMLHYYMYTTCFCRWMRMARSPVWGGSAPTRSVEPGSSWPPTLTDNTVESAVWPMYSINQKRNKLNYAQPLSVLCWIKQYLCHSSQRYLMDFLQIYFKKIYNNILSDCMACILIYTENLIISLIRYS